MAQLRRAGDFVGPGELRTARYLEESLPDSWVVICNKLLVTDASSREIDFILVGDSAVFCVDEKSWWGRIYGNESSWTVREAFSSRSPLNDLEMNCKRVSGMLRDRVPGLARAVNRPFVFPMVILSSPEVDLDIDDPRAVSQILRLEGSADELVRLDRAQPLRVSIYEFRESITSQLLGLVNRPTVPPLINDYEVLESLGGHGPVRLYRARHPDGSERQLRVIERPQTVVDDKREDAENRLLRDYTALRKAGDAGLAPRVDPYFSTNDDAHWVVPIHPVDGVPIRADRAANKVDSIRGSRIAHRAFEALAKLHALGIVHRAISPETVFISRGDAVVFVGFDLARVEGERSLSPSLDSVELEEPYAAPEMQLGLGFGEFAADVYALAATVATWLTGLEPTSDRRWSTSTAPIDQMRAVLGSEEAATVLASCLATDDRSRPSASDVTEAIACELSPPARPQTDSLDVGSVLHSQYLVLRVLGTGATGTTVLARDELTDEEFVLKSIGNPELRVLLARAEFKALRNLSHPNLPRVFDIRPPGDLFQLKLEYVCGETLRQMTSQRDGDLGLAFRVVVGIADALAYLESMGYVHRDVSPANILVPDDPAGAPRLIDFGLAAAAEERGLVGAPLYRAPEVDGGSPWSAAADQYSLAVCVYEYLVGALPFEIVDGIPHKRVRAEGAPDTGDTRSGLMAVLLRASSPDPESRYATSAEFLAALQQVHRRSQTQADVSPDAVRSTLRGTLGVAAARYDLEEDAPLHGGIADVYRAQRLSDGQAVAVKVIRGSGHQPRLLQLSFQRELSALRELHHDHIVSLVDAGRSDVTDEYFLVLEWLPSTLESRLRSDADLREWATFYREIGRPLASALAYAHEHHVVHRDVKPSNVMFDEAGVPKLVDFGISVFKTQLDRGSETLEDFMSRPFSPPERISAEEYDRDVFGFAVLAISSLSPHPVADYPDIEPALAAISLPDRIRSVLARCVSFDPKTRPANGLVLLAELDAYHAEAASEPERRIVQFAVTGGRVNTILTEAASDARLPTAAAYVEADLGSGAFARFAKGQEGERQVFVYGQEWSYRASIEKALPRLAIFAGQAETSAHLDFRREAAVPVPFLFRAAVPDAVLARESLQAFVDFVEAADDRRLDQLYEREDRRLLNDWHNTLRALERYTTTLEDPLRFSHGRRDGRRFLCHLESETADDLVNQPRLVRRLEGRGPRIAGIIDQSHGQELALWLDSELSVEPPRTGVLVVDTAGSVASQKRQREALDAVRFKSALLRRQDFPDVLIHPERSAPSVSLSVPSWFQKNLTSDKKDAVLRALGSADFFLVHGPPGTGKTTFIAELVAQELRRNPDARILLTSQTNVALDNALESLGSIVPATTRIVRLASSDGKVADEVADLLLEKQMATWRRDVRRRSDKAMERLASQYGLDATTLQAAIAVEQLQAIRLQLSASPRDLVDPSTDEQTNGSRRDLEDGTDVSESDFESVPISAADLHPSGASVDRSGKRSRRALPQTRPLRQQMATLEETVARLLGVPRRRIEEASSEDLGSLLSTLATSSPGHETALKIARLHLQWVERVVGRGSQFDEPLLFGSHVIAATCIGLANIRAAKDLDFDLCILDEASKATPTEVLVPFIRGRRWVLVGDDQQLPPFQERALESPEMREEFDLEGVSLDKTLFDLLSQKLPDSNRAKLTVQHRMVREIGDLVSDVFYCNELESAPLVPPFDLSLAMKKAVTWFNTHKLTDRFERIGGGTSYTNEAEARAIAQFVERVAFAARADNYHGVRALALSGYRPQATLIDNYIRPRRDRIDGVVSVETNTVDAAQGRQADVVAFSVTRSNSRGNAGFLRDHRRINVAISRGRYGLAIFGDLEFCEGVQGPFRKLIQHIREHPEACAIEDVE